MRPELYVQTVLAREGKQKEAERVARLNNHELLKPLQTALLLNSKVAEIIDILKRSIFYGTTLDQTKLTEKYDELVKLILFQKEGNLDVASDAFQQDGVNRLLHAALGMITESAEFAESVYESTFAGKEFDKVNAKEEIGDQTWYCGLAIDAIGSNFEEVFEVNNAKLEKRFGKAFSEDKAVNRNLDEERKVLER